MCAGSCNRLPEVRRSVGLGVLVRSLCCYDESQPTQRYVDANCLLRGCPECNFDIITSRGSAFSGEGSILTSGGGEC